MAKRRGAREGNIYQRKDGTWEGRVRIGYREGRLVRRSVYGRTRADVSAKLRELIRSQEQGVHEAPSRLTLEKFLTQWLQETAKPRIRRRTFDAYSQIVRSHIGPALGHVPLARLTPQQVQRWLNGLAESGLSGRTCQHARAVLRAALNQALKWGQIARNAAALVDPPRVVTTEIQPLSLEDSRALLQAASEHRQGALVAVTLALGLRQGETLGLRWRDVDLDGRRIHVRHALQSRRGGGWELVEPKSVRSRRTIVLPQITADCLRAHRVRQREARLLAGQLWQEHDFVFTTRKGTPLDAWAAIRILKQLLQLAGLPHSRFHDLRHTAATLLLAQGVDARTIMHVLGHSQISLTLNTYSHVLPSLQQDAAAKMNDALRSSGAKS